MLCGILGGGGGTVAIEANLVFPPGAEVLGGAPDGLAFLGDDAVDEALRLVDLHHLGGKKQGN